MYDAKYVAGALPEVPPRADEKLKDVSDDGKVVERGGSTLVPPDRGSEGCTLTPPAKGSEGCTARRWSVEVRVAPSRQPLKEKMMRNILHHW